MLEFLLHPNILMLLVAWAIGGIPFGLILARIFADVDLRSLGSKSIGATNVLRVVKESNPTLAKKLGAATLALDISKGLFCVLFAKLYFADPNMAWATAVFAVIGHCFSPYLGFEGGKGVATGLGVCILLVPVEIVIALAAWAVFAFGFKISSLASLLALATAFIASLFISPGLGISSHVPFYLIMFFIIYKHSPNIVNLIQRKESRVI